MKKAKRAKRAKALKKKLNVRRNNTKFSKKFAAHEEGVKRIVNKHPAIGKKKKPEVTTEEALEAWKNGNLGV